MAHPFGTIKGSLGWDHYLLRGKEKVSGAYGFDWALIMFCYNFKRVLNMPDSMARLNAVQSTVIGYKSRQH